MTPEERANQIVRGRDWFHVDRIEFSKLRDAITSAIRAAVEAEREECAKAVESAAGGWNPPSDECDRAIETVLTNIAADIRERGT